MADFQKIEYYDLRAEALAEKLPQLVGRAEEMNRLSRVMSRRIRNNAMIVGPSGIGKTALAYGWFDRASREAAYAGLELVQLDADHVYGLHDARGLYEEALSSLPPSVLFIDNFGRAVHNNNLAAAQAARAYRALLVKPGIRLVLALQTHEYDWLEREHPAFAQFFEVIHLKNQPSAEQARILELVLPRLNRDRRIIVPGDSLREIAAHAERFPALGQLPRSALGLLDESLAQAAALGQKVLSPEAVAQVVAQKTGIPAPQLQASEFQSLAALEDELNGKVLHQREPIAKIAATVQRAKLGIRNPQKPLGSFLMLGPSGVGKTETAKAAAELVFGKSESFIRFDMSEFGQEHTVQRLIGAPAGYIGYESGGALTNALRAEPYCLILLDEIEKAHPKIFDVFLQVLDDGRLTSGQNETVDARHAIIMATSNVGVEEILKAAESGGGIQGPEFIRETMLPALGKHFRLEFLNRFDGILVFNPLTPAALADIARLEIKKIESRLSRHRVRFDIDPATLGEKIAGLADPRFGARPVKRFIEETCESLLARSLLSKGRPPVKSE